MGHTYKQRWQRRLYREVDNDVEEGGAYPRPKPKGCNVQVVRSVSDWSHGVLTEKSIQNACESFVLKIMNGGLMLLSGL